MLARYFAYGSNLNADRVRQRGLAVTARRAALLPNHNLVFDKIAAGLPGAGHANILWAPGYRVEGALYDLESDAEILKMDPYEHAPVNYTREAVAVEVGSERIWAWTYYANAARRAPGLRPPRAYLDHLLAGSDLLSPGYVAQLEAVTCLEQT